jgi:hypothetical protein
MQSGACITNVLGPKCLGLRSIGGSEVNALKQRASQSADARFAMQVQHLYNPCTQGAQVYLRL